MSPSSRQKRRLLACVGLLGLPAWALSSGPAEPSRSAPTAVAAETWTVPAHQSASRVVTLEANVEAVRLAVLSTQVPGAIVSVSVKAGDAVRAGQELMRVDARAAQQQVAGSAAQLQAAQAQWRVAETDLQRQKQLFEQKFISQGALDKAQLAYDAAQAQVTAMQAQNKAAQVQSGFYVVQAPYAGVVSDVPVLLGDMAMPGRPLVVMHAPGEMRLSAALPQSLATWARSASTVQYEIAGVTPKALSTTALQILPSADPATRTLVVRLPLPANQSGWVPGMAGKVHLQGPAAPTESRIWIPARAVQERAELQAVRVLNAQGQSSLRQVRLGARQGDQIEVLSGLRPGDTLVLTPTPKQVDGR